MALSTGKAKPNPFNLLTVYPYILGGRFLPYSFGQYFAIIRIYQAILLERYFHKLSENGLVTKLCLFSAKVCKKKVTFFG